MKVTTKTSSDFITPVCRFPSNWVLLDADGVTNLLAVEPGRELMQCYYRYSPRVANTIADDENRRRFTRTMLSPMVRMLAILEW